MKPPCSPGDASLPGLLTLFFSAAGSALATDGIWVGQGAQTFGHANWGGVDAGACFTNTAVNGYNVVNNSARMIGNSVFTDPANLTHLTLALNSPNH